jgi:hypothetical protein
LQKALAAVKRIKDDDYRYTPVIVAKLERLSRDPPPAGLRCLIVKLLRIPSRQMSTHVPAHVIPRQSGYVTSGDRVVTGR